MKQNYGFLSEEIKINSILLNLQKMKIITIVLTLSLVLLSFSAVTNPIEALGTVLPQLNANNISPHRIFNDLMKQSLPLVPYQLTSYGSINRCWSCTLTNSYWRSETSIPLHSCNKHMGSSRDTFLYWHR